MSTKAPITYAIAVTPHDSNPNVFNGLYIGGAGNVTVTMKEGGDVLFTAVPVGTVLPIAVTKVLATGTTATGIVGLRW